jgi:hypothetical protein
MNLYQIIHKIEKIKKFTITGFHSREVEYFFSFISLKIQIKIHPKPVERAAQTTHISFINIRFATQLKIIAEKIIFALSFTCHIQAIKLKFICNK